MIGAMKSYSKTLPAIIASGIFSLGTLFFAACSSPSSRISQNQAAFDSWPAAVQEKIRAGKVDTGFTAEQVTTALGKPDHAYTRTTATGTTEVWAWSNNRPSIGFGIGVAGGSSTGAGVGVGSGVATSGDRNDDRIRVIFDHGIVSAIERLQE